jgi:Uma2 family endonuclease
MPRTAAFELPPDWVGEIISPGRSAQDRAVKLPIYARAGVGHAWLVDPRERTLEIFRLEAGRWVLLAAHTGDERPRAEPFADAELELERWWLPPEAP